MPVTVLDPAAYRRFPWKNGGGVTIDIAEERETGALPGGWDGVIWRLGRTTISAPAPFSDLTGFARHQVVIRGRGLVLVSPDGDVDLREPFRPVSYGGERAIVSRLEDGPVEVVNLIADRARCDGSLVVLAAGQEARLDAGSCHVLHAPDRESVLVIDGRRLLLSPDEAVRVEMQEGVVMMESGLILHARMAPRG